MRWREILFTAFYTGYIPLLPGTAGTLLALIIYVLEFLLFGKICWLINLVIVLVMLYPAIRLGDSGEKFFGEKDSPKIVLDEVMGYWISVLFYPFSWQIAILAFLIFRVLDIIKPYPARKLQDLHGGLGVMIDDYIAGIYTNLIILIIILLSLVFDFSIFY